MKKLILFFLLFLLIPAIANAEIFVCFNAQANFLHKTEGDCRALGICSGYNNTGLNPDCIIATKQEYDAANQFTEKDGNAVVGSRVVPMQQSEINTILASELVQAVASMRMGAKDQFNGQNVTALSLRCEAKAILDEINTVRTWTRDLKTAIANGSTLAAIKTNVAALSTLSDRTLTQAKTAIQSCIDNGTADE